MPELPEVQTIVNQLKRRITGRTIKSIEVLDKKRLGSRLEVRDRKIKRIYRLGKRIIIELDRVRGPVQFIGIHLRMTGRLVWNGQGGALESEASGDKSLRARFICDRGELLFLDIRRFGTIEVAASEIPLRGRGVDPFDRTFVPELLGQLLGTGKGNIKTWLLRQDKISGIGNIYASEILFDAGISPLRAAGALLPVEVTRLHRSTRKILTRAIENSGTTFSDFQDSHGLTGTYQKFLKVYLREGKRCRRCKGTVKRLVQQQRSTFFCPGCQK